MHQNFSQLSDWLRKVFGLRTFKGFVIGEVGVEEN